MNYRLSTLFEQKSYSADATEVIDINMTDPISQLLIQLDVTNVGDTPTAHAIACLKKVELVDGSDVLFSLSGYEAEAVDIYHNKRMRSNFNMYLTGNGVQRFIGINFGRKLWDPELAFDPKKFTNPQLKITLDINAGGHAPVENKIRVLAALFDEKSVSPVGFLMHKEVKDYNMGVSTHEYTDLPTDYPYRKLFLRCQRAGTEPGALVNNIKLSEDQDKKIIFNHSPYDLQRAIAADNPMLTELIYFPVKTSATYFYCTPTERTIGSVNTWSETTGAGEIAFYDGDGGKGRAIAATAAKNAQAKVSGWMPHATCEVPFGVQEDIEDWFDASMLRALRLDVQATASALTTDFVQVFLQQLRRY